MGQQSCPVSAPTAAEHAAGMLEYADRGEQLARQIGNRGPLRFDTNGELHPEILDAYWKHGFFVFENVINAGEIEELRADTNDMIERAPNQTRCRSGCPRPAGTGVGLRTQTVHADQTVVGSVGRHRPI